MTEQGGGVRTFATAERLDDDAIAAVVAAKARTHRLGLYPVP